MARGVHGPPKVSPRPAPSMPCGRATPEKALGLFLGWPARRAGDLRPSSTLLDTPRCTGRNPTPNLPVVLLNNRCCQLMVNLLNVIKRDCQCVPLGSDEFLRVFEILGFLVYKTASFEEILKQLLDPFTNRIFNLLKK
jgi:hypothetical protein